LPSSQEDELLIKGHDKYGNRWTEIAKIVGGRTDNAVKNRWAAICKKHQKTLAQRSREGARQDTDHLGPRRIIHKDQPGHPPVTSSHYHSTSSKEVDEAVSDSTTGSPVVRITSKPVKLASLSSLAGRTTGDYLFSTQPVLQYLL
jgi:hypothetical protein